MFISNPKYRQTTVVCQIINHCLSNIRMNITGIITSFQIMLKAPRKLGAHLFHTNFQKIDLFTF